MPHLCPPGVLLHSHMVLSGRGEGRGWQCPSISCPRLMVLEKNRVTQPRAGMKGSWGWTAGIWPHAPPSPLLGALEKSVSLTCVSLREPVSWNSGQAPRQAFCHGIFPGDGIFSENVPSPGNPVG